MTLLSYKLAFPSDFQSLNFFIYSDLYPLFFFFLNGYNCDINFIHDNYSQAWWLDSAHAKTQQYCSDRSNLIDVPNSYNTIIYYDFDILHTSP